MCVIGMGYRDEEYQLFGVDPGPAQQMENCSSP